MSGACLLAFDGFPGFVRVEASHLPRNRGCVWAEILLVNDALVIDDECFHARDGIFIGKGHERETANHFPFNHIIHRAARRVRSLCFEDAEIVAVIRDGFPALGERGGGIGKCFGNETFDIESVAGPRTSIVLASSADPYSSTKVGAPAIGNCASPTITLTARARLK